MQKEQDKFKIKALYDMVRISYDSTSDHRLFSPTSTLVFFVFFIFFPVHSVRLVQLGFCCIALHKLPSPLEL